ncbi:hypothetical protein, partial [Burkholderia ubonensis]|uniref:hypothetical protein n=1 Tax=Burkholderia ubonensis TaxID=101571 RepID=UPI001E46C6FB
MPAQPALAQSMTIRARAWISMAPSPILVGRRFCPRFLWSAGNFFGSSRITGIGGLDLEEEVGTVAVAVG